ncbi:MAG: hypothetical protein DHS20C17_09720 [Cyclobacteriaceae bacterium]|nr:MAG: hypothetical protein DHS20C17_09720 [Cyclobacteriaceae bacterium]
MKTLSTTSILAFMLFITSCGLQLVPFTADIEYESGLSKDQLKTVQFFNSGPIVLYREINNNITEVLRGEIKMKNGRQVEQIVIPPNTPGVVVSGNEQRLGVSFEKGTDRYLVFGRNPKKSNAYTVLAKNWKNGTGTVQYDGEEYKISTQSASTYLVVNMKRFKDLKVSSRTAKGRSVGK